MTPTHLAIVMEYASGGELFERICNAGRFPEDEVCNFVYDAFIYNNICIDIRFKELVIIVLQARFFFQQLVSGVGYCHNMVFYKIITITIFIYFVNLIAENNVIPYVRVLCSKYVIAT